MNPLVSIMIATYNQPGYIVQAVESCLNQDYENIEVVVGDDSTNDDVYKVLQPLFSNPKLKYFRNPSNLGRVKNYRKLLFDYAKGDSVVMLDGDDYYLDMSFISKAAGLFNKNRSLVLVSAGHLVLNEQRNSITEERLIKEDTVFPGKEIFYKHLRIGQHSTNIYKRDLALALDFYRLESMGTDSEGLFRLALHGDVAYLADIPVCWRIHDSNNTFKPEDAIKQMHEMVFIDNIYKYSLDYIDKKAAQSWRKNLYCGMSNHVMHLAERSGSRTAVLRVLRWASKFWGAKATFHYLKRFTFKVLTAKKGTAK